MAEQMSIDNEEPPAPSPPDVAYVRSMVGEDDLSLRLLHNGREVLFQRSKAEACTVLCRRLGLKLFQPLSSKKQRRKRHVNNADGSATADGPATSGGPSTSGDGPAPRVFVAGAAGEELDGTVNVDAALVEGHSLWLGPRRCAVLRNAPGVTSVRLPRRPLVGCPLRPELETEFCAASDCRVRWFLHDDAAKPPGAEEAGWRPHAEGPTVTLIGATAGLWLKVSVLPRDSRGRICGFEASAVAVGRVEEGPTGASPILKRHAVTAEQLASVRAVSYNILADLYADSDHSRDVLYPYCPRECLEASYRRQVVLWELAGYNADLICLQEVDRVLFDKWLRPSLDDEFEHSFLPKLRSNEGLAIFFRRSKFQLVADRSLASISDALFEADAGDPAETVEGWRAAAEGVRANEAFSKKWSERNSCMLTLVLRAVDDPSHLAVVATTHLYFHPVADHIRLLQGAICLRHLERVRRAILTLEPESRCGVVFAGDFNSDPRNGFCELALTGSTRPTNSDWYSCGRAEFFGSPVLKHGLGLASAYDLGPLEFTNYTAGYRGVLDYIFFATDSMRLTRAIPLPSREAVVEKIALPNEFFPSDHLALVADLEWT